MGTKMLMLAIYIKAKKKHENSVTLLSGNYSEEKYRAKENVCVAQNEKFPFSSIRREGFPWNLHKCIII